LGLDGVVLDVVGAAGGANGAGLQLSTFDGSPDMIWQFEATTGGMLELRPYSASGSSLVVVDSTAQLAVGEGARWKLMPGLADRSCVSFRLSTQIGVYLRHASFLLWVNTPDGPLSTEDATFCFREGLAASGADLRALESFNYRGYFITSAGDGQLSLKASVDTDAFRAQATWIVEGS
jgi:hypothetical protein